MMDAARHYKARIVEATRGLEERAEANAARVEELEAAVTALGWELRAAGDRHLLALLCVELAWEGALDALWDQTWITMRPFPRPRRPDSATRDDVDVLLADVEAKAAQLRDQVQGRRFRRG
jgi:hypothetical protein